MRLGLALPQYGRFARPEAITEVARAAEELGFTSLWVGDRILTPVSPQDEYPGGGGMPEEFRTFLDPLTVLTVAATATRRARLGTSTLNVLWHSPILLARTLTSLDVVSGGRVDVGVGLGWLRDEYEAAGVPWQGRGRRLDEWLDTVEAIWASERVEHSGPHWAIPPSDIAPRPVQTPRPPLLLGGVSPAALARIGRRADGWLPIAMPLPYLAALWDTVVAEATAAGRDPATLRRSLRVNPKLTEDRAAPDAPPGLGTRAQLVDYLLAAGETGVEEIFVDLQQTAGSVAELLDHAAAIASGCADVMDTR